MKPKRKPRSVAKAQLSSGISARTNPSGVVFDEKDTDERAATVYRGFLSHLDDTERDEAFAAMDELGSGPPLVFDSTAGQAANRDDIDRHYRACADAVRPWVVKDAQNAYALQEQGHAHP